jgi:hypothetical protein
VEEEDGPCGAVVVAGVVDRCGGGGVVGASFRFFACYGSSTSSLLCVRVVSCNERERKYFL